MCQTHKEKREKWSSRRNRTTKQKSIKTFAEKENYKYSGIFKEDTIKQAEMKKK